MSPELLAEIESVLVADYGDLRVVDKPGEPNVIGSFPLVHGGDVIDRFQISIDFPSAYPLEPPTVREIGCRIPHLADRHNSDGYACLFVPLEWKMKRPDLRFRTFMMGPVHNYFLSQRHFEIHGKWPFGERDHGVCGEVEAACDLVGVALERWGELFTLLTKPVLRGHWRCPCGSGERLRSCHLMQIRALQRHATPDWAEKKINQLRDLAEVQLRAAAA